MNKRTNPKSASTRVRTIVVAISLAVGLSVGAPAPVFAEESIIISLNEQISREVDAMKAGFEQLGTETPAKAEAREWAKRARELPTDSPEFARARAEYVHFAAEDLEYRFMVAGQTYQATASLTDSIDRLIVAQEKAVNGRRSILGGDSDAIILEKARQLQGIDRMMATLIASGVAANDPKVKMAQQAFQVKVRNNMLRIQSDQSTGIEKLAALRDTTEGLAFLMRAYADGLELQHMRLSTLAISGQADAVFADASEVVSAALRTLDPEGLDFEDENFFMDAMTSDYSDLMGGSAQRPSIADEIGAAAALQISRRQ